MLFRSSQLTDTTVATKFGTEFVATPENKYGGTNKGGYSNPELDRLYTMFNNALDLNERNKYYIGINKIVSEQVPGIPLYYQQEPTAYTSGLVGPLKTSPGALGYWNIQDWTFTK